MNIKPTILTLCFACLGTFNAYAIENNKEIPLETITLADARLDQCLDNLAQEYGWKTTADVTALYCTGVDTLSGVEAFTQLQESSISIGYTRDLTPFSLAKKLTQLTLESQALRDISPLRDLKHLEFLNLGSNPINDVQDLSELTALTTLYLFEAQISDISPLAELTHLKMLNLDFNPIHTVGELDRLKHLEALSMSNVFAKDLHNDNLILPIGELKKLTTLALAGNHLTDVTILQELSLLEVLDLSNNPITHLEFLQPLSHLRTLLISDNLIQNWDYLTDLPNLEVLNLRGNFITTIPDAVIDAFIHNMPHLKEINLYRNPIVDCNDIEKLSYALPETVIIAPGHCAS